MGISRLVTNLTRFLTFTPIARFISKRPRKHKTFHLEIHIFSTPSVSPRLPTSCQGEFDSELRQGADSDNTGFFCFRLLIAEFLPGKTTICLSLVRRRVAYLSFLFSGIVEPQNGGVVTALEPSDSSSRVSLRPHVLCACHVQAPTWLVLVTQRVTMYRAAKRAQFCVNLQTRCPPEA